MDCDGFEEILFGCPSSQDSVGDDMWDYDSQDEEMLYAPSDDQLTSWNFLNSPMLSPPLIDPPCNELVLDDGKDARIDATQFHHQDEISQTGRDRYGCPHRLQLLFDTDRNWIIARIEGLIEGIVDGLLEDTEQLSITLRSRNGITRRKAQVDATGSLMPAKSREITFPGSTVQEAWRFS
jgi:meiotic recombination protein SPO11